jgi:DNA-binding winged helix-turn-helix (wHTH) protein
MKGWQYLIQKFRDNMNVLHTLDLIQDIHLAAEYRRLLSHDLPAHGFFVERTKLTPKCWKYRLLETQP